MDIANSVAAFSELERSKQLSFLAKFGHNMTIAARDTYVPQTDQLNAPERLRAINELQHRVLGHIQALLTASGWRYPDDVIVSIMLEHQDPHLRAQALWAFEDALKNVSAV